MSPKTHIKTKSIAFYTIGCRVNQSETDTIRGQLREAGYYPVASGMPADISVINTCTVTAKGDADARKLVNRIRRLNPNSRIALIGCQAQVQGRDLLKLPNVCWVVGTSQKFDLSEILNDSASKSRPTVITSRIKREAFRVPFGRNRRMRTRANLKIQDGCDAYCTYCEVPFARGPARSRVFEDILDEANMLVSMGHKEIVLTGINIGLYRNQSRDLMDVIDALEQIDELARIRISSIEPTSIQWKLIEKMRKSSKLCRFLHIPIQSGSPLILKRMERKYTLRDTIKFIRFAYQQIPQICIGTDIIVGFPGETEEDFLQTKKVLEENPLNYFHVFSYSKRNKARSRNFADPVDEKTIRERSRMLRNLSKEKRQKYFSKLTGTHQTVLFEEKKDGVWRGVTDHYVRVHVKSQKKLRNCLARVQLKGVKGQSMSGSLI